MTSGPLMVGIAGCELERAEIEVLRHPRVGGVILFTRNYRSRTQLRALCDAIHELKRPPLLIGVDHEGGRVQRFRNGFTALPAAAVYGALHDRDPMLACRAARIGGWLMAAELRACGVDFSFAPVLDLRRGVSSAIGNRAFHGDPRVVVTLARAFQFGMRAAGFPGVGKHFPGHGSVATDSHHALPVDRRPYAEIRRDDLLPFRHLAASELAGIIPAHIVFEHVDSLPAGFSRRWITDILRGELGFRGIVFSDDLDMAAAAVAGDHVDRTQAALDAGCDVALLCNDWQGAVSVVDGLRSVDRPRRTAVMATMRGRSVTSFAQLASFARYRAAVTELESLTKTLE